MNPLAIPWHFRHSTIPDTTHDIPCTRSRHSEAEPGSLARYPIVLRIGASDTATCPPASDKLRSRVGELATSPTFMPTQATLLMNGQPVRMFVEGSLAQSEQQIAGLVFLVRPRTIARFDPLQRVARTAVQVAQASGLRRTPISRPGPGRQAGAPCSTAR